ncbi:MAG: SDR family NAD(P)-dependent oxidoreductase [Clostridia bacterium]|nr:SDR family NAD(P)-dependent oxidoreductase [Clostridia bacterium]
MSIQAWLKRNTVSLKGKRIAVTGSTGGLGMPLCGYLASLGASLVLLDRNAERSLEHKRRLEEEHGIDVTCISLDLEDLCAAKNAVKRLLELEIDAFFHNAGAYSIPRHSCASGYDNVFQINFATPYYMIRELLPMLAEREGQVVVVGSIAHNYSKIDVDDIDFHTRGAASKVYGNAKRYLMLSLYELMKTQRGVKLSVVHPGITFTNITAHYPKPIFLLIKHPMKLIFMKPKKAALSLLLGVFEHTEAGEWIGPNRFGVWGYPKKKRLRTFQAEEQVLAAQIAERVYQHCYEIVEKM